MQIESMFLPVDHCEPIILSRSSSWHELDPHWYDEEISLGFVA
jgi:hypothetical protein